MTTETNALTASRVHDVFMDCLFRDGEDTTNYIEAEGIVQNVGFHPGRIEAHREDIHELLAELPDTFKQSGGGGHSFLEACMDRHGIHWAEHPAIEQLIQLGIAIDEVAYLMPRDMWHILPGSMPYFIVKQ